LEKFTEKGYKPIIANRGTFAFLRTGTTAASFHRLYTYMLKKQNKAYKMLIIKK
jgi:hypothetical protein